MFEYLISLIHTFLCETHSKIKCYCNLKCCNKTNVDVPTPKITNMHIITCSSKNNIDKVDVMAYTCNVLKISHEI